MLGAAGSRIVVHKFCCTARYLWTSIFILVAGFTFGPSFRYRTKSVFSQEQALKIQHLAELLNDSEATAERLEE